ncbi:ABC transporter ATP-binding protein [Rhizobium sp. G21]|uniref:dipeptide ABC transporter ATP-binding protein n=1 Tax=Rhizobium sp. G21 TaxID=2758439 RepID=UPI00160151B7|nr:ABC transporter ATP-binding protein [Rhizobium sp. G21]MBB1250952.1 ABC transporter ATP-binding protein [Rhizobium sp. G21]
MSTDQPLLSVRGLTTKILTAAGPRTVVDGLSFDVKDNEILAIIGESGSGKSVATQSIMGLMPSPPAKVVGGQALFEGRDLLAMPPIELRALRGNRIGMIFQEPMAALNPMMAVGDQIAEALVTHRGLAWNAARAETLRLLDRVRIPDAAGRAKLHPSSLSGGMCQRVVIAAALACKPSLVIADEPTTALDATVQAEIIALIRDLQQEVGCGVIFITHDMGVVRQIADRILVMQTGRAIETGSRIDILDRPTQDYTRLLIKATSPATPKPPASAVATVSAPPLVIEDLIVSFARTRSMTSFKSQDRLFAMDGASLTVSEGETVALVGESGSGKTTIARAILGLVEPDNGRVLLKGQDVNTSGGRTRGRVQFIFQDPQSSLDPRYRAWRSVIEPLMLGGERDKVLLRRKAENLMAKVGLDGRYLDRYPHELSGGQRQRLGIARALSVKPDLVIADEAVSALDATTRLQVLELFEQIQAETRLPILFITHDFAVVTRIAHRVAVMRFGRMVEIGPTASVLAEPRHAYTRALIAAAQGGQVGALPASRGHRIGLKNSQRDWRPLVEVAPGHFVEEEGMVV